MAPRGEHRQDGPGQQLFHRGIKGKAKSKSATARRGNFGCRLGPLLQGER